MSCFFPVCDFLSIISKLEWAVLLFISVFREGSEDNDQTVMQWDLNLCSYMYSTLSGN